MLDESFWLVKGAMLLCGFFLPPSRTFYSADMGRLPHTPRRDACAVKYLNNSLARAKIAFFASALKLPKTFGLWEEGEFAALQSM